MSGSYRKLAKDFIIVSLGTFGSKILSFLLVPLYTSVLSTSDYGVADLINTTIGLIYPLLTISIAEAIVRFTLQKDNNEKIYFSIGLYIWVLSSVVMIPGSIVLGKVIFQGEYTLLIYLNYVLLAGNSIVGQYARGKDELLSYSLSGIVNSLFFFSLNILFLVVLKIGLLGYLCSMLIAELASMIFLVVRLRLWRDVVSPYNIKGSVISKMLQFSAPLVLNAISWWIVMSSDKYMLLYFAGRESNGIYSVSQKIPSLMVTVTGLFISAWQISSVEDFGSKESEKFFTGVFSKLQTLVFIFSTVIILLERIVSSLLFANDFYVAWKYIAPLIIANGFYVSSAFLGSVYTAAKDTKKSLYSTLVGACINIVLNYILIPKLSIMGACIATAVSYYVVVLFRIIDIRKGFNLSFDWIRYHIQYGLIIIQAYLMFRNSTVALTVSAFIPIAIVMLNKNVIEEVIMMIRKGIKK